MSSVTSVPFSRDAPQQQSLCIIEPFSRDPNGKPIIPLAPAAVYQFALLLRRTEQLLLRMFSQGLLSGTTHTCIGQELCQIAVVRALTDPGDVVLSNHRNHGHFLTYSGDFVGLVGEVMGREVGVCGGIGGSQHLAWRHFHSNGVQAGMTAIGVGHAYAIQRRGSNAIAVVVIGDGTLGQGLLYESLNLAAVWQVPLLFVVENNGIAQTTFTSHTIAGSIEGRGAAFGLKTWRLDDADPTFLANAESVVAEVRRSRQPGMLVIDTRRLGPHSKGDDLRTEEEMQFIAQRDPLCRVRASLPEAEAVSIDRATKVFIDAVHATVLASREASRLTARQHIFEHATEDKSTPLARASSALEAGKSVRVAINECLRGLLSANSDVLVLGEDLHEPYGGAFKVTAGLTELFSDRVISTPISEAGIVGTAIGLAISGFLPIVEIMFADFVTLAMDQIFNHAVKFPGMFKTVVPLVIRMPAGGRRGYGPTHSQSPESLLMAVPGLTVIFPSNRHAPGEALRRAVTEWPYPTVFMEHKLLYGRTIDAKGYREIDADPADPAAHLFPTLVTGGDRPDITLVCYGDTIVLAEGAAARLNEEELSVEIVIPSLINPIPRHTLTAALIDRDRIIVIEEAPAEAGFGTELATMLLAAGYRGAFARVAPPPVPIPAARSLESLVMPRLEDVIHRVVEMVLCEPSIVEMR
jgi:2-oxoisovalerate dehydrogenase E1 component